MAKNQLDEIGPWSEAKLDILRDYASAYMNILANQNIIRRVVYVDAFAGAGADVSRQSGELVPGSPANALSIEPPFDEFHLNAVWGDDSWRKAIYKKQKGLFGDIEEKRTNEALAEEFRKRLEKVAGFKYVPPPVPMRNSTGAVVYYLYFASPNKTGHKIVSDIFSKYRKVH